MRRLTMRALWIGVASYGLWIAGLEATMACVFGVIMLAIVAGGGYTPTFAAMDATPAGARDAD